MAGVALAVVAALLELRLQCTAGLAAPGHETAGRRDHPYGHGRSDHTTTLR